MFTVAFCGLPSAGKSTIINSLIGERRLQSGVCRTTYNPSIVSNLVSDDGVDFTCIDTPGICDSEDTTKLFDTIMLRTITQSNLIFWVSDVVSAFMTMHERREFINMQEYLTEQSLETGKGYQVGIILSKCEVTANDMSSGITSSDNVNGIIEGDEDTGIVDCIKRVKSLNLADVMLFNARGRCVYGKGIDPKLKHFIASLSGYTNNINIEFNIMPYFKNVETVNEMAIIKSIARDINRFNVIACDFDYTHLVESETNCLFIYNWKYVPCNHGNIPSLCKAPGTCYATQPWYFTCPNGHNAPVANGMCQCGLFVVGDCGRCVGLVRNNTPGSMLSERMVYRCKSGHTNTCNCVGNVSKMFPRHKNNAGCICTGPDDHCALRIEHQRDAINFIVAKIGQLKNKQIIIRLLEQFDQQGVDQVCRANNISIRYNQLLFDLIACYSKIYESFNMRNNCTEFSTLSRMFMIHGASRNLLKMYHAYIDKNPSATLYTFVNYRQVNFTYNMQVSVIDSCIIDSEFKNNPKLCVSLKFQNRVSELRKFIYGEESDLDIKMLFTIGGSLFQPL